jgi:thioredoxin reductase (NADPH)
MPPLHEAQLLAAARSADTDVDCVVIGGGPAGLTAAIYLCRFRRTVAVIDSGFSRASLIPETHNYPGFVGGISGADLLAHFRKQASRYGARIDQGTVTGLEPAHGGLRARLGARSITARKVVLATGIIDEKPALPSLREFIYRGGLRFCPICDGYEVRDRRIGVLGPAKHAVKKALFLRTYSKDVTVLALDGAGALDAEDKRALREAGIPEPIAPVTDLLADGDTIKAVLENGATVDVEVLYPAMGAKIRSELASRLGATCNDNGCLIVDDRQRTSVTHLYAVGDVTLELHQLSVAVGQAAIAATDIHNCLEPNYC